MRSNLSRLFAFTGTAAVMIVGLTPQPAPARVQSPSRQAFDAGMRTALAGRADSAMHWFTRAENLARSSGERLLATAALRGQADVWLTLRACPDSALRILRDATASAAPGDHSAADALIRLLAARGDVAGARATLVSTYANADVRRAVTHESVGFLGANAAIALAEGREAAAMSTLNEAIGVADRLHAADAPDPRVHASGDVTRENAWLIFDLAQLRAHAKSPSIRLAREASRLMTMVTGAWNVVDDLSASNAPTVRLGDRLLLRAEQCRADGTSCPVPTPPPGC